MTETPSGRRDASTWTRLRRRKVVQWSLAYVAFAWAVLQGLQYVGPNFGWPVGLQRYAILAALAGLPIVTVLAWYHGDRGEQRVSGTEVAVIAALLLFGGGVMWRYGSFAPGVEPPTSLPSPRSKSPPRAASDSGPWVAVLPFENRSRIADDALFVDGIYDDILTQLSKLRALNVTSRTSAEHFRDARLSLQEIAAQLGVANIVEGGVQRDGDRVRIHVQLIDAASDKQLWAETYDRELKTGAFFAIQSEVAMAVAEALNAALTSADRARAGAAPTQNYEAWEAFRKGKERIEKRNSADLAAAVDHFREAIAIDPGFAPAYVGLADALVLQVDYSGASPDSTIAKADEAVATALKLDPGLGEAWASAGNIAAQRLQKDQAEGHFRRAIELNPNYMEAHHWLSFLLWSMGRFDESLEEAKRAVELSPFSPVALGTLGSIQATLGRFSEAERSLRKSLEVDPDRANPYGQISELYAFALNRQVDAATYAHRARELDPGNPERTANLARLYYDLDDPARAHALIDEALRSWPDNVRVNLAAMLLELRENKFEAAASRSRDLLATDPRIPEALATLSLIEGRNGNSEAARALYVKGYPELLAADPPKVDATNYWIAIDAASVLLRTGQRARAEDLLERSAEVMRTMPRLGRDGYWISDVQVHALRGDKAAALEALRAAERAGWRGPMWLFYRDHDPALDSIRNEPEFKAVFADIERDMARQRAELAKRPNDASLPAPSDAAN